MYVVRGGRCMYSSRGCRRPWAWTWTWFGAVAGAGRVGASGGVRMGVVLRLVRKGEGDLRGGGGG